MRTYYAFVVWCTVCYFAGCGIAYELRRVSIRLPGVTEVEHYR